MTYHILETLARYKQWADAGLYRVIMSNRTRIGPEDMGILIRILDHSHVVDQIFRSHLQGIPHDYESANSITLPGLDEMAEAVARADRWYVNYVAAVADAELLEAVPFTFTDGTPACMRRSEMLLHVMTHSAYHRGNAGILLQKNGIPPNKDVLTRFVLESA